MKTVRAKLSTDLSVLKALNTLTFPGDVDPEWAGKGGVAWIVYDDGEPVAFIFAHEIEADTMYFSRVGVMPAARGRGLQRHLMKKLSAHCRKAGYAALVSTTRLNPASANNFVREGWMTWLPEHPWGATDTIYWRQDYDRT